MNDTIETVSTGISSGIGRAFVGPLVAGAIESPDMRAATWSLGFRLGLSVGLGLLLVSLLRK
jgi:hypothetical protein